MSLKEDMEILERHLRNGTARAYFEGTADPLPPEPKPTDPSATSSGSLVRWITARGD